MYRNKENRNTEVHGGGGLELVKPAREPASSRPKPCAFLKKPHESCPFAAPCGPRRKKNDRGQRSAFPSETSRFKPVILAHRGSALSWLVNCNFEMRIFSWSLEFPETVGKLTSVRRLFNESGFKILIGQRQLFVTTTFHLELLTARLKYRGKSHLERGTYTIAIGKF